MQIAFRGLQALKTSEAVQGRWEPDISIAVSLITAEQTTQSRSLDWKTRLIMVIAGLTTLTVI
jgi:hypothetical protein